MTTLHPINTIMQRKKKQSTPTPLKSNLLRLANCNFLTQHSQQQQKQQQQ